MNIWGLFFSYILIPALLFILAVLTYIIEKEDYRG